MGQLAVLHRDEQAFAHVVGQSTPDNLVEEQSREPNGEAQGVAQRYEVEFASGSSVAKTPRRGDPNDAESKNEIGEQVAGSKARPTGGSSHKRSQHRPRQAVREQHAEITRGPNVAKADGPPQFVP